VWPELRGVLNYQKCTLCPAGQGWRRWIAACSATWRQSTQHRQQQSRRHAQWRGCCAAWPQGARAAGPPQHRQLLQQRRLQARTSEARDPSRGLWGGGVLMHGVQMAGVCVGVAATCHSLQQWWSGSRGGLPAFEKTGVLVPRVCITQRGCFESLRLSCKGSLWECWIW
jgi:hypothetical protein